MGDKFWKRADYIFGLFPFVAIFAVLVVSANVEIKDLDLWLHMAVGEFVTLHRYVPGVDILSCSIAGTPWVNHEWLFQVIVYNIFNSWGPQGLITMQVVIVSLTMLLLLFLGYSKNKQLLVTVILFLLYMIFQQRFTIRPDLFSLLFFSIYIFVLSLHVDKKWSLPVLLIVQIFWSNMHGFFFFGPLFVMIGIFSEFVKRHVRLPYQWNNSGRLTDEEYQRIKVILLFVVAACLINPMFVKGAWYPIGVFFSLAGENKIFFENIVELRKPVTLDNVFNMQNFVYYKVMIALSFISFIFNRRRIDISALIFWFVFLIFSLSATRNISFFAFAAYLVIITNFQHISYDDIVPIRFSEKRFFYITTIFLKVLFLVWIYGYYQSISTRSYYDFEKYSLKSEYGGVAQRSYPDKAADFLVENNIQGNFFNDFNSGAYLLGRAYPEIKVFIDGRTEVYGGSFFKEYVEIWEGGNIELFEKAIEQHKITGAFLNSTRYHIPKKLLNYLENHDQWHMVYFDYDAVIFLKDADVNKAFIDQFRIDLLVRDTVHLDLFKIGPMRVKPYQSYYRAYTLESLGYNAAAIKELNEALRVDPYYSVAHDLIGKIYAQQEDYQKAFEHFRIAAAVSPHNKEIRHNLALSYTDLDHLDGAIKQYEVIVHMWPQDPKGHFLLSKVFITNGQYSEALEALRQAQRASPKSIKEFLELGDLLLEKAAYAQAQEVYMMALATGRQSGVVHRKLGRAALAANDPKKAKMEFEKALSIDPDNEEIEKELQKLR